MFDFLAILWYNIAVGLRSKPVALPLQAPLTCYIDGFAKMLSQASIFASWWNCSKSNTCVYSIC